MAHEIRVLHSNRFGYVGTCENCGHIHLELGSFIAVVSQDAFFAIVKDFKKKASSLPYILVMTPNGTNKLIIQVSDYTFLSLTPTEFNQSLELFEMSEHLLGVYNIIRSS